MNDDPLGKTISERDLQNCVVELANLLGYWHFHDFDSRSSNPGMLDLFLVGKVDTPVATRVIHVELKSRRGRLRESQRDQIARLKAAGQEVYIWRPEDWRDGSIAKILSGKHDDE